MCAAAAKLLQYVSPNIPIYPSSLASQTHFSHSLMPSSLWPNGLQHARLSCPSQTPKACSDSCPLSQWCHPTISSSVISSSPAFNLSQHQGLFQWVNSSHQVAKALELQHQSFWFQCLLISWPLSSLPTVILELRQIKSITDFPFYLPGSDGTGCHDPAFLNVEF